MKKCLNLILIICVFFLLGCKEKEAPIEEKEEEYQTKELINASHVYDLDSDEVNPYIVVKGLPGEDNNIIYSVIIFLNFPMNYNGSVLTKRYYNYLQCDYYTENEETTYYHTFLHSDDDGAHLSNAFNIAPRYVTKDKLTKIFLNLQYEYELDSKQEKEIKFCENILSFDESNFSDIISQAVEEEKKYSFDVLITKNEEEDFNRYKLIINLDKENATGHYDIQTWVKCNDKIIPFLGYYHYRVMNGNIQTVSDEKISIEENVNMIYYMVRYYDSNGNITNIYYQKKVD